MIRTDAPSPPPGPTPCAGQATVRVGLYGGAFDPPHLAHVALAREAVRQLGLDRLYIVPTGQPWMKERRLTDPAHRLAMARLAFAGLPEVVVDDCELRRQGTTYTIDTLRELQQREARRQGPCGTEWFLVMGQDLVATLPRWQRAQELLQEVTVAVLGRPGSAAADLQADLDRVRASLPQLRCVQVHLPPSAISSTAIRERLAQAGATASQASSLAWLSSLVPPEVARYIALHQLYRHPDGH